MAARNFDRQCVDGKKLAQNRRFGPKSERKTDTEGAPAREARSQTPAREARGGSEIEKPGNARAFLFLEAVNQSQASQASGFSREQATASSSLYSFFGSGALSAGSGELPPSLVARMRVAGRLRK